MNYNSNACGALQSDITLQPGESKELIFVLGQKDNAQANEILASYEAAGKVDSEVEALKEYWHGKLNHFQVSTPSDAFNNMINVWNAYQCFITFIWSRAASFVYCGLRNGYGYRDTVQDIQGIIHLDPELAAEKIRFMLSAQVDNGGGLPLVKFDHNAGHETHRTIRNMSRKLVTRPTVQTMLCGCSPPFASMWANPATRHSMTK